MVNTGESIAAEFDTWLNEYTEKMVRIVPFYFQLMEDLRSLLPEDFRPNSVMDLGAGNGNLTAQLAKWFPEASHTLIDASDQMLAEAKGRFPDLSLTTETKMIQDVAFEEERMDLIAASFSLHHLPLSERRTLFEKMHRGLRPGGYFIYSDLMVETDGIEHPDLLSYWKDFVLTHASESEWKNLMVHYDQYDFPASEEHQVKWLMEAGFSSIQVVRHDVHWVAMVASH